MTSGRRIVVVGAGPAGVAAAMAARQQDAAADVLLLSDEHCEPYEKPPLSKAVLTGKAAPHDAPIAGPKGVAGAGVTLRQGVRVTQIDRAGKAVLTDTGERIGYDALVLATGSVNRVLPMFPAGTEGHPLSAHRSRGQDAQGRTRCGTFGRADRWRRGRARDRCVGGRARAPGHRHRDRTAPAVARVRRGNRGADP